MEIIDLYFPEFTKQQLLLIQEYEQLLKEWNSKINLISRKNEDQIIEQHILHSLSIAKFVRFLPFSTVLDLGTGGGLPGIPLAIAFPNTKFHLIDSIGKKIKAVAAMTSELGLNNVTSEQIRVEQHQGSYDFVVTRAVAPANQLLQWTAHLYNDYSEHAKNNGLIALKGGDLKEELAEVQRLYEVIPLSSYFTEEFFQTKKLLYIRMKKSKK